MINRLRITLFTALLAGSGLVNAATLYVARDGQTPEAGPPAYTNWTAAASNIQDAVNAAANGDLILVGEGTYTMVHSCSTRPSPPAGAGNIELEPGFIDPGSNFGTNHVAGNYRLIKGAPCIDAGTNVAWTATAVDLDGNPRRDGSFGLVDMGAYEYMYTGTLIIVQ